MANVADAWRPANELEHRMRDALQAGDQETYFRLLAEAELVVPIPPEVLDDVLANETQPTWPTREHDGRVHVLAFTSSSAMHDGLGPGYRHFIKLRFSDAATAWPDARWWLALDPGLPIEGFLPSWFVRQIAEGDPRLPQVGRPTHDAPPRETPQAPPSRNGSAQPHPPHDLTPPDAGDRASRDATERTRAPHHPEPPTRSLQDPPVQVPATPNTPAPTDPPPQDIAPHGAGPQDPASHGPAAQGLAPHSTATHDLASQGTAPPDTAPHGPPAHEPGPRDPAAQDLASHDPASHGPVPPDPAAPSPAEQSPVVSDQAVPAGQERPASDAVSQGPESEAAKPQDATVQAHDPVPRSDGDTSGASPDRAAAPTGPSAGAAARAERPAPRPEPSEGRAEKSPVPAPTGSPVFEFPLTPPAGAPTRPTAAGSPGQEGLGFQPANEVERELLLASGTGDQDAFLRVLAAAEVLLPVPQDMDYSLRPGRPAFPWPTGEVDGVTVIPLFTSPERLREVAGEAAPGQGGADHIALPFLSVARYWPDHGWGLAVNHGTPVGSVLPGERLKALSEWADQVTAQRMAEGFEPQNDIERRLFEAATRRDGDAFFKVLLSAQVLVPAAPEIPWGIGPDDEAFPWHPTPVRGAASIQVFTSLRWMHETIGPSRFLMPAIQEILAAWPDREWTLVVNPGTPINAIMPGDRVRALADLASPPVPAPDTPDPSGTPSIPGASAPARDAQGGPAVPGTPDAVPSPNAPDATAREAAPDTGPRPVVDDGSDPNADWVPARPEAQHRHRRPTDEPVFEPGNRIDQELYEAAQTGDTDAFLRVLLAANVLVPIPADAPLEITPVQPEFRWEAAMRDASSVQVFTSLVRLREALPASRFVYADFRELIRWWPRTEWAMFLNPGTRIGASLLGDQVHALSEWAVRVGLIRPRPQALADPSRTAAPTPTDRSELGDPTRTTTDLGHRPPPGLPGEAAAGAGTPGHREASSTGPRTTPAPHLPTAGDPTETIADFARLPSDQPSQAGPPTTVGPSPTSPGEDPTATSHATSGRTSRTDDPTATMADPSLVLGSPTPRGQDPTATTVDPPRTGPNDPSYAASGRNPRADAPSLSPDGQPSQGQDPTATTTDLSRAMSGRSPGADDPARAVGGRNRRSDDPSLVQGNPTPRGEDPTATTTDLSRARLNDPTATAVDPSLIPGGQAPRGEDPGGTVVDPSHESAGRSFEAGDPSETVVDFGRLRSGGAEADDSGSSGSPVAGPARGHGPADAVGGSAQGSAASERVAAGEDLRAVRPIASAGGRPPVPHADTGEALPGGPGTGEGLRRPAAGRHTVAGAGGSVSPITDRVPGTANPERTVAGPVQRANDAGGGDREPGDGPADSDRDVPGEPPWLRGDPAETIVDGGWPAIDASMTEPPRNGINAPPHAGAESASPRSTEETSGHTTGGPPQTPSERAQATGENPVPHAAPPGNGTEPFRVVGEPPRADDGTPGTAAHPPYADWEGQQPAGDPSRTDDGALGAGDPSPRFDRNAPRTGEERHRTGGAPLQADGEPTRTDDLTPQGDRDTPQTGGERPRTSSAPLRTDGEPTRTDGLPHTDSDASHTGGERAWTSGAPLRTDGEPTRTDRLPPRADSDASHTGAEQPWTSGAPLRTDGEPTRTDGLPHTDSDASHIGGERPWNSGAPLQADGEPTRTDGLPPRADSDAPHTGAEQPWTSGAPLRTDGGPARTDGLSSQGEQDAPQTGGERPRVSGTSPWADGGPARTGGPAPQAERDAPRTGEERPRSDGASLPAGDGSPWGGGDGAGVRGGAEGVRSAPQHAFGAEAADDGGVSEQPVVLQKVLPHGHVGWYLEQGYDRVGGFVHPVSEVTELQTPAQLYETLGLLYEDSPFSPDDDGVYVIRWPGYCAGLYRIPFGGQTADDVLAWGDAGWVQERPPFVGSGFAPGSSGSIREYKVDSARLPYGAEMYYLDRNRSERFVALYDPDRLAWVRPGDEDGAERVDGTRAEAAQ
ncbi:SseB family protein [Thermomonospora umbrina]|uniref:Type III secretion system (T3SS) SseB-like protein n=1 Tax=Thermomonospora umbrina TaxID=111806 RepID=A0A3D9SIR4_9ACTN|nr:SseB family protein [Thermomonospora umbrina]REE95806.1 type III secretion system (T3SS) SseB-like protein [Thermomonospora umbrina]